MTQKMLPPRSAQTASVHGYDNALFEQYELPSYKDSKPSRNDSDKSRLLANDSNINKQRRVSLVANDYVIVTLEYLQLIALLQAMSLHWTWPASWLNAMSFLFLFNADIWEFSKLVDNGTYVDRQDYYVPSDSMPLPYWSLTLAWAVVMFVITVTYGVTYFVLTRLSHPFLMVQLAKLQRVGIIAIQVMALPVGVCMAKVFHCAPLSSTTTAASPQLFMDVSNDVLCFTGDHWAYVVPVAVFALVFYVAFPAWLISKTKDEFLFPDIKGHEAYLQLKETEYVRGLDSLYIVGGFHVFSSFRLTAAHLRASLHVLKFVLLILYAAMNTQVYYQILIITICLFGMFVGFCFLRPYRLMVFNMLVCLGYLCLTLNALLGVLRSAFSVYSLRTVWLTPSYVTAMLAAINGIWLVTSVAVLIYLALHTNKPLWPSLTASLGDNKLPELTQKFMRSILVARQVAERCTSMPAIFAPAHEVSRQIQIVNAHCREAEATRDALEGTLWHLLDELVVVHSQVADVSLFADSVGELSRATAERLVQMAPAFVRRLAQREYDFLLVPPKKRRLLLKLYCLGMFLSIPRKNTLANVVHAVSSTSRHGGQTVRTLVGYSVIMHPEKQMGPRVGFMEEHDVQELNGGEAIGFSDC